MNLLTRALDIAFRRIASEGLLKELLKTDPVSMRSLPDRVHACFQRSFMAMAELTLSGYSYDEQENVFAFFDRSPHTGDPNLPPFHLLTAMANRTLEENQETPSCKFSEVLHWRDAYLLLGQDIFTAAWLAERNPSSEKPVSFSWPAVIPVNHPALNRITEKITENHMHLYAGASTFSLSWCCLMNHPETVFGFQDSMEQYLQMQHSRETRGSVWSFCRRMVYAIKLREILFRSLHCEKGNVFNEFSSFHFGFVSEEYSVVELTKQIEALRAYYGLYFEQPGFSHPACLDYAFTSILSEEAQAPSRLLASERFFLFHCFQKCFSGAFSATEQWIFFIYLLLKTQFRGELIQVNRHTGFHNFKAYDSRKKTIWKYYPEYLNEDIYQAINAVQAEQGIVALEGRICPMGTAIENIQQVHHIDRSKLFFNDDCWEWRWKINNWRPTYDLENLAKDEDYSFILHFPKEKDLAPQYSSPLESCRHQNYRRRLRSISIQIAQALSNSPYFNQRVIGIDACSNEIGCRPEVFAQSFRFLRNFQTSFYNIYSIRLNRPNLSATYHVGEDFLDIADGLRAMDETVWFLNLSRGDRFGHALALGVNPRLHYKEKHHQIILPKQDLLDNMVWLCTRSVELGTEMPSNLRYELMNRAEKLYWEIYGKESKRHGFFMEPYYHSMMLRGDAPELYAAGKYQDVFASDLYDDFSKNNNVFLRDSLEVYRQREEIVELYFLYHYNQRVKEAGTALETMEVTPEYVKLMSTMQKAMQKYLNDKGISIECNPSSNVLIGTFSTYQNHPILNFYNIGLNVPHKEVQMHVSINTDDPGVFDTSLKFEYALLAKAIGELRDEMGQPLHNDREIEDYILNLVQMGHEQSFFSTKRKLK